MTSNRDRIKFSIKKISYFYKTYREKSGFSRLIKADLVLCLITRYNESYIRYLLYDVIGFMSDIFVLYASTYTGPITAFLYCRRSLQNANKTVPAATKTSMQWNSVTTNMRNRDRFCEIKLLLHPI